MSEINPTKSLDALLNPSPLTLGQMALLDYFESPCAVGDFRSMCDNGIACWLLDQKRSTEILTLSKQDIIVKTLEWMDSLSFDEFQAKVIAMTKGISDFYDALPKADEAQKKTTSEQTA